MDDKKQFSRRLLAIGALFSLVLAAYFVTLFDAQIVHGAEYRARSIRANTKSETVVTSRGILTDREISKIQKFIKQNYQEMYLKWSAYSEQGFYNKK